MILQGDCRDVLATLEPESVQCCVTSPPYWGLRDYGTASWEGGDPGCSHQPKAASRSSRPASGLTGGKATVDAGTILRERCHCGAVRKDRQLGLEATPEAYVANMVAVFREVRRVLRPDGVLFLNLGDSYAGSRAGEQGAGGQMADRSVSAARCRVRNETRAAPDLKPKDLVGIPWRVAFALQADGWCLRSDIIWSKPNPMPESVTDRPTKAHEYIFLLSKSERYFYDADAIAEELSPTAKYGGTYRSAGKLDAARNDALSIGAAGRVVLPNLNGNRNARSVWEIATRPYAEAHFATFPPELARRCILAGTSEKGCCPECGAPWERVVERGELEGQGSNPGQPAHLTPQGYLRNGGSRCGTSESRTTGWRATCDHDGDPIPCTVLDPFNGAGTTGLVAQEHHREYVGIELNAEYVKITDRRLAQNVLPLGAA